MSLPLFFGLSASIGRRTRPTGRGRVGQRFLALAFMGLYLVPAAAREESESSSRLITMVKALASDEMEGRGVGTRGLDAAAEYIAQQFRSSGLKTDIIDGQPFQSFTVGGTPQLGPAPENRLTIQGPDLNDAKQKAVFQVGESFSPLAIGGSGQAAAGVVFVGYGITAADWHYDDYAQVDVAGKIVIMLRKEPQQGDRDSVFSGTRSSPHATFQSKIQNAIRHGAVAVIMVNDDYTMQRRGERLEQDWRGAVDELAEAAGQFGSQEELGDDQIKQVQANLAALASAVTAARTAADAELDELPDVMGAGVSSGADTIPVFFCRRGAIDPIVTQALGSDLATLERRIDDGLVPQSRLLEGWTAECQASIVKRDYEVKNVIGVLEGSGPLADETIVIGAHYDHVGRGGLGSLARGSQEVHNGADDNASGTAGVIELAQRMAAMPAHARRRLVFIAFAGEERGLLGSAHYVKTPVFPLEKTVAMINLDMIGRLRDDKLEIGGTGTASEFAPLIDTLNESYRFVITKQPRGSGPSDHASFYRHNIPVLFFFTGLHEDYHRPSDDYDKINVEGMLRVTDFVAAVLDQLDDAPARPAFQRTSGMPRFSSRAAGPHLGVLPDLSRQDEGFVVMSVVPGGPAEQAGVQAGDVVTQLGDDKIADRDAIAQAILRHKAGDEVTVIVQRDGQEKILKVTLQESR